MWRTHHRANLSIAERRHDRVLSTLTGSVLLVKSRFPFVGHVKSELLDERKVCGVGGQWVHFLIVNAFV